MVIACDPSSVCGDNEVCLKGECREACSGAKDTSCGDTLTCLAGGICGFHCESSSDCLYGSVCVNHACETKVTHIYIIWFI